MNSETFKQPLKNLIITSVIYTSGMNWSESVRDRLRGKQKLIALKMPFKIYRKGKNVNVHVLKVDFLHTCVKIIT